MNRMDRAEITLIGNESFDGPQKVSFIVEFNDQNDWLVLALRRAWQEHYDRLVSSLKDTPADPSIFLG